LFASNTPLRTSTPSLFFAHQKYLPAEIRDRISVFAMYTYYTLLGLLTLLSKTLAAPHDEHSPGISSALSPSPKISRPTKTITVTVTQTSFNTSPPQPHTPDATSGFVIPSPPNSMTPPLEEPDFNAPTGTTLTIICPHPTEPCIMDGIAIWPSGTTSLLLPPSFSYEPLPTSKASHISLRENSTLATLTVGTSGSPTSYIALEKVTLHTPTDSTTSVSQSNVYDMKRDVATTFSSLGSLNSTTPAWKTEYVYPQTGGKVPGETKFRRGEKSGGQKRRRSFWSRFFVAAE
jgi:hypothetical protein